MRWLSLDTCSSLVAAAVLSLIVGCGDSANTGDPVADAWTEADLEPAERTAMKKGLAGGTCTVGDVSGISAIVCVYQDEFTANKARKAGLNHIGSATGLTLINGRAMLVVVDKKDVDVDGKKIAAIAHAFEEVDDGTIARAVTGEGAEKQEAAKTSESAEATE